MEPKNKYPRGPLEPITGYRVDVVSDDADLITQLRFNWTTADKKTFSDSIRVEYLERFTKGEEYPPRDWTAFEQTPKTVNTMKKQYFLRTKPRFDNRSIDHREKQLIVNDTKLQHTITQNESLIVKDKHTKETVLVVIRDAAPLEVLEALDKTVVEHIKDDPGYMASYGYTTGQRGKQEKKLDLAANISGRRDDRFMTTHLHNLVSMQALAWNTINKMLPEDFIENIRDCYLAKVPRLDWNQHGDVDHTVPVSVVLRDKTYEFSGFELGPPGGVCSSHYSKRCHKEKAPEKCPWVLSLTTKRTAEAGRGGSFYLAEYRVLVQQRENSVIAHRCSQWHGTAVQDIDLAALEKDQSAKPGFLHRGFSMCLQGLAVSYTAPPQAAASG